MPTKGGLPQRAEVWERKFVYPFAEEAPIRFVVLERSRGDYWALRVFVPGKGRLHWVDASYWFQMNELSYLGPAGPETKKKLNLA